MTTQEHPPIQPIRTADRTELHDSIADARDAINAWGDRLAATRGADARWLTKELDRAVSALRAAVIAVEVAYPDTKRGNA